MKLLIFDLGTTLFKVALFDDGGTMLDIERVTPPIEHPQENRWELRTVQFLDRIVRAARKLRERAGAAWQNISAISFATQANSFTLLDPDNQPMLPLILWPDQSAIESARELEEISKLPDFRQTTGMPRFGPLLALAKLLALQKHRELIDHVRGFCFLSDYLTKVFTGTLCTEAGVAGLSGACDIRQLQWWQPVLRKLNTPIELMPPIVRAGTEIGPLAHEIADVLGLPRACRFVAGTLDQYAGAIGTGTITPGSVCETTGTVLAAVRCSDRIEDRPGIFQGPSFDPNRFFQMTFSSTSANLLDWYRSRLPDCPSFDELTRLAATAGPSDLVIEPYDDRGSIEQAFRHVRPHHSPGQIVRAIMQRVARSLAQQVDALCGENRPSEIRSAGGAARNDLWLQMKADTLRVPFVALECEEPTSLGAAILAASAVGCGTVPELAQRWIKVRKRFDPM